MDEIVYEMYFLFVDYESFRGNKSLVEDYPECSTDSVFHWVLDNWQL